MIDAAANVVPSTPWATAPPQVPPQASGPTAALVPRLREARQALRDLVAMLASQDWRGPYAPIVNPPLWEYGHIAWFQEFWCLRRREGADPLASPLLGTTAPSRHDWADWLYDSSRIPHAARWHAPLLPLTAVDAWGNSVLEAVCSRLDANPSDPMLGYFAELSLHHEAMHTEAWWMMWQVRGLAPPTHPLPPLLGSPGRISLAGGEVVLGSDASVPFAFDNERGAHRATVAPFDIDVRPVTNGEYLRFVEAGGYATPGHWTPDGRAWLASERASHPVYWRREGNRWLQRTFDRTAPVDPDRALLHVNRYEAEAYATWAGRALPSPAEWVLAAGDPAFRRGGCWEWTRTPFRPYPAFAPGPYRDYSEPWFESHTELRGAGSIVTSPGLARTTFRNFYLPHRRDPFAGFRTVSSPAHPERTLV
jgi:ergothioneine biosynthesis protein EgtB